MSGLSRVPLRLARTTLDGLTQPLSALWRLRLLLALLLRREIAGKTSGTLFRAGWLLLAPALQVLAFWFLLDVVLRVRLPGQVIFLDYFLVGILAWFLMIDVLQRSLGIFAEQAALYQRSDFPLVLLPLLPLIMAMLIHGTLYLVVCALLLGLAAVPAAVALLGLLFLLLLPASYLLAVLGHFLRDLRQLLPFALTMGLYVTPILYSPNMLPSPLQPWLVLNPFADVMAVIHGMLQDLPVTAGNWLRPFLLWLALLGPAWVLFRRSEPHLRETL